MWFVGIIITIIIIKFILFDMEDISFFELIKDLFFNHSSSQKEQEEIRKKEEEEIIRKKEEEETRKKYCTEFLIPKYNSLLESYEIQLERIENTYEDFIQIENRLQNNISSIKEFIEKTKISIENIDIDYLESFRIKTIKCKYLLNNLEYSCLIQKVNNNLKNLQDNLNLVKNAKDNKTMQSQLLKDIKSDANFKDLSSYIIKSRDDIIVNISNFYYGEYNQIYGNLSIINNSLDSVLRIDILAKIYDKDKVIGCAYANQTLVLNPGEDFENTIRFFTESQTKGDNITLTNYKLHFKNEKKA